MQVLGFFLEKSLFDLELFQSYNILTSRSIQLQFQKAVKDRAKKNTILIECFWLLDESETESFLKVCCTPPHYSENNSGLFPGKNSFIPRETSSYSGNNLPYSAKKAGYSWNHSGFSDKNPENSKNKNLNNISNTLSKRAITREEKQNLIQEFGAEITEEYIRRTSEYHCCNPETIRKWITKDQKKHKRNWNAFTSFPQRNYDQNVMDALERYLLRDDRKDTKKDINYK